MAIIAFTDISGDVDYFAFVSHLYGKGLQVSTTYSVGDVSRPRSSESESVRPV